MRKIVVFTQRVEVTESYSERRDCIDQRVTTFLKACGYIPIAVPNNKNIAEEIVYSINPVGIVLTGGNSLVKYGGNAPERDSTDKRLIEISIVNHIPLYGFCRGMQSILDFFGETLVDVEGHVAKRHNVCGEICGCVNSYHNQACVSLSDNSVLGVNAESDDGVIEAVHHKELPIIGNMWHPEREEVFNNFDIAHVRNLIG